MNLTPLVKPHFIRRARRTDSWACDSDRLQSQLLRGLLRRAASTEAGRRLGFTDILLQKDAVKAFAQRVPCISYEDIRPDVNRMIAGERDILWPGRCRWYAQSSGTSGGKSKYIPVTDESLRLNHYRGAEDSVSHYIAANPSTRMFAGKGMILGGSFANELHGLPGNVHVGDLSATLIERITPLANLVRVPSKRIALLSDWEKKLPALAHAAARSNVTNISGVPSWFLTVIKHILAANRAESLSEIWPNLEVFFHGGIAFGPYRDEYERLTQGCRMHFVETYNASEGFFATQNDLADPAMLLIIDSGVYYEFIDISDPDSVPVGITDIEKGKVYELVITAANGLWRYRLGDTVRIESTAPVKITIAGRTKSFINAFGEELMECNAEEAIAKTCRETGASVRNYTAGPVFTSKGHRGRHEWIIEWEKRPADMTGFTRLLDEELQRLNSDYQAKRSRSIFLDPLSIVDARPGLFEDWMASSGSQKLGGQRKVPRLSNDRHILDALIALNGH